MINSLNELSSVYLNQIAEQEQTPEAVRQRVSQMVKAIRYRARKEAVPVSKAFNDYIGSVNATSMEKQFVKERLGLTGGATHKEEYVEEKREVEIPSGDIAKLAKKASARIDSDVSGSIDNKDSTDKTMGVFIPSPDGKKKIYGTRVKESFSNWRQDLSEVMDEVEASKEIKEKKVKNKVVINPVMKEAVEELGGELIEMIEIDEERNDEPGEGTRQKYGDMRGLDRSGAPTSFGGKWQSKERKVAGAAALAKLKKEETEIDEGMTMKDFKANRRKLKRREASADAKKRGHVGKEWYNSGRTYSPDEAKFGRAKLDDAERSTRHRSAVDPDAEDDNYSADKTKNPKKLRKQKAMGELGEEMQINEMPYQVMGSPDGGKEKKIGKPVKSKKYADARAVELADTHKATGGKYRSQYVENVEQIDEKALSKQQQKFMGMVYAVKKGRMAAPSPEVAKAAAGMTTQQAKDFAKTKHKGLPSVKEAMDEPIDQGSGTNDKNVEMQKKKIQAQKIRDLNIRLQAARKGVY